MASSAAAAAAVDAPNVVAATADADAGDNNGISVTDYGAAEFQL